MVQVKRGQECAEEHVCEEASDLMSVEGQDGVGVPPQDGDGTLGKEVGHLEGKLAHHRDQRHLSLLVLLLHDPL